MEPLKLYSSRAQFGIAPRSGSVYPHSGWLCYEGMEGGTPDNRGALKVVLCEKGGGLVIGVRCFVTYEKPHIPTGPTVKRLG